MYQTIQTTNATKFNFEIRDHFILNLGALSFKLFYDDDQKTSIAGN